jgi:hypothetical protein
MKTLKQFILKYVLPPPEKHLVVLATDEKEALLMRTYFLTEGFEA